MTSPGLPWSSGTLFRTTCRAWMTSLLCALLLASGLTAHAERMGAGVTASRHEIVFIESNVADHQARRIPARSG